LKKLIPIFTVFTGKEVRHSVKITIGVGSKNFHSSVDKQLRNIRNEIFHIFSSCFVTYGWYHNVKERSGPPAYLQYSKDLLDGRRKRKKKRKLSESLNYIRHRGGKFNIRHDEKKEERHTN
jgi:hypothetical protein